jgi:hypothetical protein
MTDASSVGGFYAINRRGQVLLPTVNETIIVPFVSGQVCLLDSLLSVMFYYMEEGHQSYIIFWWFGS